MFSELFPYLLVHSASRVPLSYPLLFPVQNDHFLCYDGGGDVYSTESGSWVQDRVVLGEVMTRPSPFNRTFEAD